MNLSRTNKLAWLILRKLHVESWGAAFRAAHQLLSRWSEVKGKIAAHFEKLSQAYARAGDEGRSIAFFHGVEAIRASHSYARFTRRYHVGKALRAEAAEVVARGRTKREASVVFP